MGGGVWPSLTGGNHGEGCGQASQEETMGEGCDRRNHGGGVWLRLRGGNHG